ncbi:MAG: coproporphyrinogen III oxidase family protein [Candidatus Omnitrophica bacterium]|nr:coproporphyrinogen III oxidase family protein [Candidatus Omnitrophota bacterium]MBU4468389.1 coproporphyrinogen III oxidase family protein [Candidatus Omnitrophota bacterium]MCG2707684.1 coproporphyrinogen III oxidase family protein [Candidatus Omnitrophota bacterium]
MIDSGLMQSAEEKVKELNIKELQNAGVICLDGQFFPSVHYPPITMYPLITEEALFKGYNNPPDGLFVIYAHIPFCMRYCAFCHYPVKIGDLPEEKDYYLNTLEKEMDIYMRRLGVKKIKARSILVGGGTPTYLTPAQLERFLLAFTSRIDLTSCTQFSYDVDPTTLLGQKGIKRLKIMRSYGVNRLTIGIQSLDDLILKKMNRPHNAKEAIESIHRAKDAGFKLNIEFIYGYPGQTLENWHETIKQAVSLGVEEIQLYRLKVIPYGDNTGMITNKFSAEPDDFIGFEKTILMKTLAIIILAQNGYHENLTRVFSRKREDFSHYANDQCCNLFDQIGFGLTAFHSLRDRFGLNTQDFKEYYSLINQGRLPINRGLIRNADDQLRWAVILPLKNRAVYKNYYKKITGASLNEIFRKKIEKLKDSNLLYEDDKLLKLTERGRFFADEACQQFHHPKYMPFSKTAYAHGKLYPYIDSLP